MKVAILAGGRGSRLPEAVQAKSKAMVPIGDLPILWHIMKYYARYGFHDFVVALGHRGDSICDYFTAKAARRPAQVNGARLVVYPAVEPEWTIELVETGLDTMSGGRIKRLAPYVGNQPFMLTWCDGLADVRLDQLLAFHQRHGRIGTLTAVHPPGRFGRLDLAGDRIVAFKEKVENPNEWINGAFFVFNPGIFDYIDGDATQFEQEPLGRLAADGQLMAFRHDAFWQCMDTGKEVEALNALWETGAAPWKLWN